MMRKADRYGIVLLVVVSFVIGSIYGYVNGRKAAARRFRYEVKFIEAHGRYFMDLVPVKIDDADAISKHKNTISIWLN